MLRRPLTAMPVAALLLAGCGKDAAPVAIAPVTGAVTYAGQPAAGVKVFFVSPAAGLPGAPPNPHAVTGPDGRFTLTTFTPDDGAAAGAYQVVLFWPADTPDNLEQSSTDRLLGWYTIAQSKLTAAVPEGGGALAPFNLPARTSPPEVGEGIPGRN